MISYADKTDAWICGCLDGQIAAREQLTKFDRDFCIRRVNSLQLSAKSSTATDYDRGYFQGYREMMGEAL